MRSVDEVHCPECEDPECLGCVEIRSEDLSGIKLKKYSCPICGEYCEVSESIIEDSKVELDTWADEGGSIPTEEEG